MVAVKQFYEIAEADISDGREVVGVTKRVLVGPADGAPTFAIRQFRIAPGGHTAYHSHPYEHGIVVMDGEGEVVTKAGVYALRSGNVVFVPPKEEHQFRNTGAVPFHLLCIVPRHVEG